MAASTQLQSLNYRDAKGQTASFKFWITSLTAVEANMTDVATAVSNAIGSLNTAITLAFLQSAHGPLNTNPLPLTYGVSGADYQEIQMKAQFTFTDSIGTIHRFAVPAPGTGIFKADRQTVDPANGFVATFIAAMTAALHAGDAFVSSRDGEQIKVYIGGVFRAGKVKRRLGITVKDSTLTTGLPAI